MAYLELNQAQRQNPTKSPQQVLTEWYENNPNTQMTKTPALPNSGYSNQPSLLQRLRGLNQDTYIMSRGTGG